MRTKNQCKQFVVIECQLCQSSEWFSCWEIFYHSIWYQKKLKDWSYENCVPIDKEIMKCGKAWWMSFKCRALWNILINISAADVEKERCSCLQPNSTASFALPSSSSIVQSEIVCKYETKEEFFEHYFVTHLMEIGCFFSHYSFL